ncbi:hypothetical protein [Pseudomonas ovata]|uniref:hypothetical protein n=1 Tax=Pseudomonas ovata TaxID=1839709 RepID=UPI0012601EC6|nr:hypothetical protein [Pseudomonas ovata]
MNFQRFRDFASAAHSVAVVRHSGKRAPTRPQVCCATAFRLGAVSVKNAPTPTYRNLYSLIEFKEKSYNLNQKSLITKRFNSYHYPISPQHFATARNNFRPIQPDCRLSL